MKNFLRLFFLCLFLQLLALWCKPYIPVSETKYASVAWEMWLRKDFLVPHLNGALYTDKPPVLFWLFHLGWAIFGVNNWWPRAVPMLFSFANLILTAQLAKRLWPQNQKIFLNAPWILFTCLLWSVFSITIMLDLILTLFVLLAFLGMIEVWKNRNGKGWVLVAAAIGFGILTKGPVVLVFILPVMIFAPWWDLQHNMRLSRWYSGSILSLLFGIGLALLWAIPAAKAGGEQYANAIFLTQIKSRVVSSFAHERSWGWYILLLPCILTPWSIWPPLWQSLRHLKDYQGDASIRFCFVWFIAPTLLLMLVSAKQVHYLLPILPAFALLAAYALSKTKSQRQLCLWPAGIVLMAIGLGLIFYLNFNSHNFVARLRAAPETAYPIMGTGGTLFILGLAASFLRFESRKKEINAVIILSLAFVTISLFGLSRPLHPFLDVTQISRFIAQEQQQGTPIVFLGKYRGQYQFLGRLTKPIPQADYSQIEPWVQQHPGCLIVAKAKTMPEDESLAAFVTPYLNRYMVVWRDSWPIWDR